MICFLQTNYRPNKTRNISSTFPNRTASWLHLMRSIPLSICVYCFSTFLSGTQAVTFVPCVKCPFVLIVVDSLVYLLVSQMILFDFRSIFLIGLSAAWVSQYSTNEISDQNLTISGPVVPLPCFLDRQKSSCHVTIC